MSSRLLLVALMCAGCRTYDVTYTTDAGMCDPPGHLMCPNNICADITTDRTNCGGCSKACSADQLCAMSSCVACPTATPTACGNNGAAYCADLTSDNGNCGACMNVCPHGTSCKASACVCSLTTCPSDAGPECVDTSSDVEHCGSCAMACPTPAANETALCNNGQCSQQCISPFADCDGIGSNGCETNIQTSSTSCGACGRSCNGGAGACTGGMCPFTVYTTSTEGTLIGLAIDSSFVYWGETMAGSISKEALGGGATQLVFGTANATSLAVDATRVAWMSGAAEVDSRLLTGGAVTNLATLGNGVVMTLVSGFVYYITTLGTVARVPEDGSTGPVTLTTVAASPAALAVDASNVYIVDGNGNVMSVPVTAQNANPATFANAQNAVAVALDTTNVYWTTEPGLVVAQAKTSATAITLAGGLASPGPLASDGVNVYWVNGDGSIRRVSVNGGATIAITPSQANAPTSIAVDATSVYFTGPNAVESTSK